MDFVLDRSYHCGSASDADNSLQIFVRLYFYPIEQYSSLALAGCSSGSSSKHVSVEQIPFRWITE